MTQIRIKHDGPRLKAKRTHASPWHGAKQQMKPLTHHEILALMAPFTARGRHADLAASRRDERVLAFKPIAHEAGGGQDGPPLREDLVLDLQQPERLRLVRTVTVTEGPGAGLSSTLTAEGGGDPVALLERIDAVPVGRQVKTYDGVPLVRGYHIGVGADGGTVGPVFVDAAARVEGVNLTASADRSRGMPAEIKLTADPGWELRLPEDLTAVIGWKWRPLVHIVSYWRGSIKVARREPDRTPDIETRLGRTVIHLRRTLSRPPGEFHARHRRARWRVTFQRAIPMLIGIALVAATPLIRVLDMEDSSILRMLIFHAPPLMLVGFFLMREMPKLEIPPFPRRLLYPGWIVPAKEQEAAKQKRMTAKEPTAAVAEPQALEAEG